MVGSAATLNFEHFIENFEGRLLNRILSQSSLVGFAGRRVLVLGYCKVRKTSSTTRLLLHDAKESVGGTAENAAGIEMMTGS